MTTTVDLVTGTEGEQTRARYPDQEGYVERDGVRIFYEVYGDGRADGPAHADVVDHPLALLEDADPLPRAPRRVSPSTGAETAAPTAQPSPTPTVRRSSPPTRSR